MKVLIINGSPKGKNSITFQTALYLGKKFPQHTYRVIHAGARIRLYENDFDSACKLLNQAELIVFVYPVYTFMAPSQLHSFIKLLKENVASGKVNLEGKYSTQITTSKHFYDVTAHNYIEDNCRDMKMKVLKGFSADMDDLTTDTGRKEAVQFWNHVLWDSNVKNSLSCTDPVISETLKDIVVVADLAGDDYKLKSMLDRFISITGNRVRLINIHDFPFMGGCISCFNCAEDGKCIYNDGFEQLLRDKIQTGSAIVLAFSIKDHSMGSVFKTYDDRQFCNGHRTVTMGLPFGYIINGELSKEENLRTVIEARAQVGGNHLAAIATNENDEASEIENLAKELAWCIRNKYTQPRNFYGVAGMKIFRDLIWQMQGLMKADYKFYKENGQLDFPQKKPGRMFAMYAVGAVMGNEKIKSKIGSNMNSGMLKPYKDAIKKN